MAAPSAVLSQTLQALTGVKFDEINKKRARHVDRQSKLFENLESTQSQRERIVKLVESIKDPVSDVELGHEQPGPRNLEDMQKLLDQSRYDASVPTELLNDFEDRLRRAWLSKTRTYAFAHLFAKLLQEWIEPPNQTIDEAPEQSLQTRETEEEFQMVERDRLRNLCDRFERGVFTPLQTDEAAIERLLESLFEDKGSAAGLAKLRKQTRAKADFLNACKEPFDTQTVRNCIKGLLNQELLKDEKKTALQDFEKNDTVLNEIVDVLNLRFADLDNWSWNAPEGLPVEPRRQLNGKWRIMADEDILQAIFLQLIALHWGSYLKDAIQSIYAERIKTKNASSISKETKDRHRYFKGCKPSNFTLQSERASHFINCYLDNLPSDVEDDVPGAYDDDTAGGPDDAAPLKQRILRLLAADIMVEEELNGEVAAAQGDLAWYGPLLPHSTILALMKFFGIPGRWLEFFRKYLEAPLDMSNRAGGQPRTRKRGTPIASALAAFIGEIALVPMDLLVHQASGLCLYRKHADFWFSGSPQAVSKAWETIEKYVTIAGMSINRTKCGSVYRTQDAKDAHILETLPKGSVEIGFLQLEEASGRWKINQRGVTDHINQLRSQLSVCTSVFAWVTTWNSCIGRFFNSSFGQPSMVFGNSHVQCILETHQRIQSELFPNHSSTVSQYLRQVVADRFNVDVNDVPDAFLFLPQSLGGLGLKNPFVPMMMLNNGLKGEPEDKIKAWRASQRDQYAASQRDYLELGFRGRLERFRKVYDRDDSTQEDVRFPSFEEWTSWFEATDAKLAQTYQDLLQLPRESGLSWSWIGPKGGSLTTEELWVTKMYARDLYRLFGEMRIVKRSLLPLGVLNMMSQRQAGWSMIL